MSEFQFDEDNYRIVDLKSDLSKKLKLNNKNKSDFFAEEIVNVISKIITNEIEATNSNKQLSFGTENIGWTFNSKKIAKVAKSNSNIKNVDEIIKAFEELGIADRNNVIKCLNHLILSEQKQTQNLISIEKRDNRLHKNNDEQILSRREAGSYYTPEVIVDFIIKTTVGTELNGKGKLNIQNYTFFDPAMGTGNFLMGVVKYLTPILAKRNQISNSKAMKLIAENCLFGTDIDKTAINAGIDRICRATGADSKKLKCQFLVSDGLDIENIKKYFKNEFTKNGGFKFVIGNPPYVDYRKISPATKKFLHKFKSCNGAGKVNLYVPFIEASIKQLTTSGKIGLIVPNQWLSNNQGMELRKLIIPDLTEIIDVSNIKIFDDASTYPVLLFANRKVDQNKDLMVATLNEQYQLTSSKFDSTSLPKEDILNTENFKIKTSINPGLEKIWNAMKSLPKLEDLTEDFVWGTSQSGYGKKKRSLSSFKDSIHDRSDYIKILQTADVKKMNIEWQEEFLPKEIFPKNQLEKFKKKKLVIARLTKSIQCAFDDKGFALGKVSFITHNDEDLLKAIAVILSSTLISTWFRDNFTSVHMAGGYLRYDIPYLKLIPMPILNKGSIKKLSVLHDKVLKSKDFNLLDSAVNELYHLTSADEQLIFQQFKKAA
ncbi:MAG: Eco57I restriction-modification methylase domain-containing protein [Bdellovibrio sp.]